MIKEVHQIPYQQLNLLNPLVQDYLHQSNPELRELYQFHPFEKDAFLKQIESRKTFPFYRETLVEVLKKQYHNVQIEHRDALIEQLGNSNTYTITTGHQLNLFTGPQYFVYKIASCINLSQQLKQQYPAYNFLPVFWLASEDHDFDEIKSTYINNEKVSWETKQTGAVGEFTIKEFEATLQQLSQSLGISTLSTEILKEIKRCYKVGTTLSEAIIKITDWMFGAFDVLCLDANHPSLKKCFKEVLRQEILDNTLFNSTESTRNYLEKHYKNQVNPRPINVFYKPKGLRERIVAEADSFTIQNTNLRFSKEELLASIESNPEYFSPNAVLRPVYQELILPNIAYIGGAAEVAYWLELKSAFTALSVSYPIVMLRNSFVYAQAQTIKSLEKEKLSFESIFNQSLEALLKEKALSNLSMDSSLQKEFDSIQKTLKALESKLEAEGFHLNEHLDAQTKRIEHLLAKTSNKIVKAAKLKEEYYNHRLKNIQKDIYPNGGLKERTQNIIDIFLSNQSIHKSIEEIVSISNPLNASISIYTI
jgi:bacillithiol synthase